MKWCVEQFYFNNIVIFFFYLNNETAEINVERSLSVKDSRSSGTMAFDGSYIKHSTDCHILLSIRYIG